MNRTEKGTQLYLNAAPAFAAGYSAAESCRWLKSTTDSPFKIGSKQDIEWWKGFFENCADAEEDATANEMVKWRSGRMQNIAINGDPAFCAGYRAAEAERSTGIADQNPYEMGTKSREQWYNGFGCNCSDFLNFYK